MVHFFNHLAPVADVNFTPSPVETHRLPDIPYGESEWHQVQLSPAHAGVLTHPSFLLRFQTNRARASRFYEAFLCAPFVPPDGGLPAATEEEARDPDLQRRAGCKYCHASLEPAAAHWGRWTETGAGFLDPNRFPALDEGCLRCARGQGGCTAFCRRNYLTRSLSDKDEPYLGMLKCVCLPTEPSHASCGTRAQTTGPVYGCRQSLPGLYRPKNCRVADGQNPRVKG